MEIGNEGVDHTSASKCLDLCQAVIGQGQGFNFSLTYTGTSYTFSLDTRSKDTPSPTARKKTSPSTLRRNVRRREEFLKRKAETTEALSEKPKVQGNWSSELVDKGAARSVKVKLKRKPPNHIPQLDGNIEESSIDAEVQTMEVKPITKDAAVQVDKPEITLSPETMEIFHRVFPNSSIL